MCLYERKAVRILSQPKSCKLGVLHVLLQTVYLSPQLLLHVSYSVLLTVECRLLLVCGSVA
jgi:hypothetical protein